MTADWEEKERYVRSVARRIVSRMDFDFFPEDLAQEALLRAWERRDYFDENKCSWAAWVYRKVRRVALSEMAKLRLIRRKLDIFRRECEGVGEEADLDLERAYEVASLLSVALGALSPRERLILFAIDCEGFNYQEVGLELGVTRSVVYKVRLRALKKARRAITVAVRRKKRKEQ